MTELVPSEIDVQLQKFVRVPFSDDSSLTEMGIDSLTAVRIIVGLVPDEEFEIDAGTLSGIETIGQFRRWLRDLIPAGASR
ncbi:phosphopantetheine-binding protein [Saccharopolyspora tripterygii]